MKLFQNGLHRLVEKYFPNEDTEIMEYGLYVLIGKIIFTVVIVLIGMFLGELVSILLFTLFYTPLRSFAGGIHAKTQFRCFIFSLIMLFLIALVNKYIFIPNYISYIALIFSFITVMLLSPVETPNKPLDKMEKKVYGRKVKTIALIETFIGVVCEVLSYDVVLNNVLFAFFVMSFLLVWGELENKLFTRRIDIEN